MVSLVDTQVGRLVDVLAAGGVLDHTIIAINADQGLQLGEHGLWKKRCFYEQNVCVPFILSCPDLLPRGKVIEEPVEMVDFLPTLMDMCGLSVAAAIQGRSLMPLIRGVVKQWRPACFCEHDYSRDMYAELRNGGRRCVMVRTKRWKLVSFVGDELKDTNGSLYDLENDPEETANLYGEGEYGDILQHLHGTVRSWDKLSGQGPEKEYLG
jgi:arylsulfatase A-like enzyme